VPEVNIKERLTNLIHSHYFQNFSPVGRLLSITPKWFRIIHRLSELFCVVSHVECGRSLLTLFIAKVAIGQYMVWFNI
jgi:hypothetical protein